MDITDKDLQLKSITLEFEDTIVEPIIMDFSKAPCSNIPTLLGILNVFKDINKGDEKVALWM